MEPKIVGMVTSYSGASQSDWLWKQTPHRFGKWGKMRMEARASQPDFLLLYQFNFPKPPQKISSWKQRFKQLYKPQPVVQPEDVTKTFKNVPKERIILLVREPPLDEVIARRKANYEQAQQYCGYISGPDYLAPVPEYMPAIWYVENSFQDLNEMQPPEKIGTCSWITSGVNRTENHQKRLDFLKLLCQDDLELDLYGRNLPEWSLSRGELSNKWHGMAPYYYNLAIENYADNDLYVSEKLWDALLSWCLPIYYGGPAADKLLPPGSFLRLPSMDEKGLSYIKEVTSTPDAWYQAKSAIAEARQIILHKLNLLNWLSEYITKSS